MSSLSPAKTIGSVYFEKHNADKLYFVANRQRQFPAYHKAKALVLAHQNIGAIREEILM